MLRPPESDAAGVPHTLRNDALQPIVMGRQPRFHIGKRVVKRIVDAAERRRKRPIFAQYRPVQVDERHSAHPQKGAFPKIIAAIFFIERRATQLRQIPRGRETATTLCGIPARNRRKYPLSTPVAQLRRSPCPTRPRPTAGFRAQQRRNAAEQHPKIAVRVVASGCDDLHPVAHPALPSKRNSGSIVLSKSTT